MRLFEYNVHTYVPDQQNMMNFNTKGLVIINNSTLSDQMIKHMIIHNLFRGDKNCTVVTLKEIPQLS